MKHRFYILFLWLLAIYVAPSFSQCDNYSKHNPEFTADSTYKIKLKGYVGYIFPAGYHGLILDKATATFTLNLSQIEKIEKILLKAYRPYGETNRKTSLKKFDRQYLGFINKKGEESAFIILANRKGRRKKQFQCFERVMSIGFGDFYEKNQRTVVINLKKETISENVD